MAQRVIVQDGIVLYASSDSDTIDMDFTIAGQVKATKGIVVGNATSLSGTVETTPGTGIDLVLSTSDDGITFGNIRIEPTLGGSIILNNVSWPDGTISPIPGMYLGATAADTLQFLPLPVAPVVSAPVNEIVYGTGAGITSDASFTYDSTTETLTISSSGTGVIASGVGEALSVTADTSVSVTANSLTRITVSSSGNVSIGAPAPATTDVNGFIYIPVTTGTPTGVPTIIAGFVPMMADSSGSRLWIYIGGSWKSTVLA